MPTASDTRANGVRFEVPVAGTGTTDDPYRPAIFDTHDGHFHTEPFDGSDATVTVWANKRLTPDATLDAIRNERDPLGTFLDETG